MTESDAQPIRGPSNVSPVGGDVGRAHGGSRHRARSPRAGHSARRRRTHNRPFPPDGDVPPTPFSNSNQYLRHGQSYPSYPYPPPPYGYYPPHPYPYDGYGHAYHGSSSRAHRSRSASPTSSRSNSRRSLESHGGRDTEHIVVGGDHVDQLPPIAVAGTTAIARTTSNSAHDPIAVAGMAVREAIAGDDELPISQVFGLATSHDPQAEFAPACDTTMHAPSLASKNLEAGGLTPQTEACHACGRQSESTWQSEVHKMLSLLVEQTMSNVVGGISKIVSELDVISRQVRKDVEVQRTTNIVDMQGTPVDVGTSTPFDWQGCVSQTGEGDIVVDVTTPSCPTKELGAHVDEPASKELDRPILVNLENMSTPSVDNKAIGGASTSTPNSPAKRVHCQPRLRVVPFAQRVLGMASPPSKGEARAVATPKSTPSVPKYKDPPGYEDVTDFGVTGEPYFKPPNVRPKNHGLPLRVGTKCWVLHPGYNNQVIGEAKAGVNNKSRSQQKDLVARCKDGQQYILFKKIHRPDTPLVFADDPGLPDIPMCDSVLWSSGQPEQWVRWWSRYLIDIADTAPQPDV